MFFRNQLKKHSILDAWRSSEYACVQIVCNNSLHHHIKHLMGYFEFLYGSRIIYLPLNMSEKLYYHHFFEEVELNEAETHCLHLCQYDTISTHPKEQHLPFKETRTTIIFSFGYQPVLGHVLVPSLNKTHVLVVTVKLIWLLFFHVPSFPIREQPRKGPSWIGLRQSSLSV